MPQAHHCGEILGYIDRDGDIIYTSWKIGDKVGYEKWFQALGREEKKEKATNLALGVPL